MSDTFLSLATMDIQSNEAISFHFSSNPDCENPSFLVDINLEAVHHDHGRVASLSAIQIRRRSIRDSFLEIMDEHSDELHQFSVSLFNKFGRVQSWLLEPGMRRGTGCWGDELNGGQIIYVLDMSVNVEHRGKGLGSLMLQKLVESQYVSDRDNLMCWPTPVGVTDKDEWRNTKDLQIAFFRKNGFRRVGRTGFFGYSPDPTHPSRAISSTEDAEEKGQSFDSTGSRFSEEELRVMYPLHLAIVNQQGQEVVNTIRALYHLDPSSIHKADYSGLTPIHMALSKVNLEAVRLLLELGVTDDLNNANNANELTPLESLGSSIRSTREFSETLLGQWNGYSDDELTCEYLVKRAMGQKTVSDTLAGYIAQRRWGCTCGSCAGGWLSKRMRFCLSRQAGLAKDGMEMASRYFQRGVPYTDHLLDCVSDYLPTPVRQSLYKTAYIGYQAIVNAIYELLEHSDEPLSAAAILARIQGENGVSFFFGKGGRIEYAFDAITHCAMEQSTLGDGFFEEMWEEEAQYTNLPTCANDLEFLLVRQHLGLDPQKRWGPYDDEDAMDEDDYDNDARYGLLQNPLLTEAMVRQLTAGFGGQLN